MNPPSPDIISLALLNQAKSNRLTGQHPRLVDIMATKPFADLFHDMAMRSMDDQGIAGDVRLVESGTISYIEIPYRTYHYPALPMPSRLIGVQVNVLIMERAPDGCDQFLIPDYHNRTLFCLLRQRSFPLLTLP